jgi:hypothetical protein
MKSSGTTSGQIEAAFRAGFRAGWECNHPRSSNKETEYKYALAAYLGKPLKVYYGTVVSPEKVARQTYKAMRKLFK